MTPDERKKYKRDWRAAHTEQIRAYGKLYRARDGELAKRRAYMVNYRKTHRAIMNAANNRYRAKHGNGGRGLKRDELGLTLDMALHGNDLYKAAHACVLPRLPRADRADIISALVLAMIEGQFTVAEMPKHVNKFTTQHYAEYHHKSLDANIAGMRNLSLYDVIAAQI